GSYVWISSPMSIHRLVSMACVEDWERFTSLWVPEDFRIEGCRVLAGMRSTCTLIEDDGLWFEGNDESRLFVSLQLGREWVKREAVKESGRGKRAAVMAIGLATLSYL